ncbi:hypothetical protein FGE05_06555 [Pseudomonas sp. ICMP22404]|nr:hypothetical protein FGE05_06555 [Pseudomonas sp. ICMP22404]
MVFFASAEAAQEPEGAFNRSCAMCHNGQLPASPKKGNPSGCRSNLAELYGAKRASHESSSSMCLRDTS